MASWGWGGGEVLFCVSPGRSVSVSRPPPLKRTQSHFSETAPEREEPTKFKDNPPDSCPPLDWELVVVILINENDDDVLPPISAYSVAGGASGALWRVDGGIPTAQSVSQSVSHPPNPTGTMPPNCREHHTACGQAPTTNHCFPFFQLKK
jgi:hypothetical protein